MPGAFDRLSDQDLIAVCNDGDAEAAAFTSFVQDFEGLWTGIVNVHATSTPAQAPDNPGWYYTRN
jgi:hypothetical protein